MNDMIKIAGLAAIGIASVHSAQAQMASIDSSKPWSVSAALRGFYDDNYATAPSAVVGGDKRKQESFGYEITPGGNLNLQMEQTTLNLGYIYSFRYYENRPKNKNDQSHDFNVKLDHVFSPRYKVSASDSFVSAQEPLLIDPQIISSALRSNGDNIRNTAKINFNAGVTEELEFVPGYANTFYDYSDKDTIAGQPSRKALLNRMEHTLSLDARYLIQPSTTGVIGYAYGVTDYDKDAIISSGLGGIRSDSRNQTNHRIYAGADHTFNPKLSASLRAGVRLSEFSNAAPGVKDNHTSPYIDASLTYTYAPGSIIQAGVRLDQNATDVGALDGLSPVFDAESTAVYVSVSHKITEKLTANLLAQYQHSEFQGGVANGLSDDFFTGSVNLNYQLTKWLSAETGYTYDKLDSELKKLSITRDYDRNRVFIGVRATY